MPTLIDSLFVELGFDTTKMPQQQRQAVQSLKDMEREFERSGRGVRAQGQHLQVFFAGMSDPIKEGIKHLQDVAVQSRRTGSAVAAGAGAGAAGLAAMAAAGLGAYTALKAVQGVARDISNTIGGTAAAGRLAQWTGVGTQWMSALGIAANVATNADKAQTGESIFGLRQSIESFKRFGQFDERLRALSFLGVDFTQGNTDTAIQQIIEKLSGHLSGLSAPEAQAFGSRIGFQREFTGFLHQGRGALDQGIANAMPIAVTQQQTEAAQRLQRAINELESTWDSFIRKMVSDHPKLTTGIEAFKDWLRDTEGDPAKIKAIEIAVDALATVFGVTLVAGLAKAAYAINSFWALPALRLLAKLAGPLGWLSGGAMAVGAAGMFAPDSMLTPEQQAGRRGLVHGAGSALNQGLHWLGRVMGYEDETGKPTGTTPRVGPGTGEGHVAPNAERIAFYRQYAASKGLNPDAVVATVAGEGLNKYVGDKGTSFGDFQLHVGGGMGDAAVAAGLDIRNPNTWKEQAKFAMDRMAEHRGDAGWYAGQWHGAPAWAASQFSTGAGSVAPPAPAVWPASGHPLNRGFSVPPDTKFSTSGPNAGKPYSAGLAKMTAEQIANDAASMKWIKTHQGGVWGPGATTNNHNFDNDVNIGHITVQTNNADAVRDLSGEIVRQLSTSTANTGLE